MKTRPFNLEEALKGANIVTSGKNYNVIGFRRNRTYYASDDYPYEGYVQFWTGDNVELWFTEDGRTLDRLQDFNLRLADRKSRPPFWFSKWSWLVAFGPLIYLILASLWNCFTKK